MTRPNHEHLQMSSVIAARPQHPYFSTVVPQSRSVFGTSRRHTQPAAAPTEADEENKKLLEDLKLELRSRQLEELDQISCLQKMDLQFNRDTWEKFHQLKSQIDDKKGLVQAYSNIIKDLKFVLYLGSAGQMCQLE